MEISAINSKRWLANVQRGITTRDAIDACLGDPTWGREPMNDIPDGMTDDRATADLGTLADRSAISRAAGARGGSPAAAAVVRVLSTQDRGAGESTLGVHPPAGAAEATLRLRHLRGRRDHAAPHPRNGGAHRAGDRPGAGGTPDLRGREPHARWTRWRGNIGMPACVTSWHCAAIPRRVRPTSRIPRATPLPSTWLPG